MNENIKIYVATHKRAQFPDCGIYVPIRVGSALNDENFGFVRDDTQDNISKKNKSFCELTAIYWIWKNDKSDIVGLTHYRRYFFKNFLSNNLNNTLDENSIKRILKKFDIIVPNKTIIIKHNNIGSWKNVHHIKDYELCREIISDRHPDYLDSFDKFSKSKTLHLCNMFICSKKYFDDYCTWLFDILFELEKRVDISSYDEYNKRLFGFLSERLFNVWLDKNKNLKIKRKIVFNTDRFPHNQYFMIN